MDTKEPTTLLYSICTHVEQKPELVATHLSVTGHESPIPCRIQACPAKMIQARPECMPPVIKPLWCDLRPFIYHSQRKACIHQLIEDRETAPLNYRYGKHKQRLYGLR